MFVKKHSNIQCVRTLDIKTLESKRCYNVKSLAYNFHMKIKVLTDFQICISVPLKAHSRVCEKFLQLKAL